MKNRSGLTRQSLLLRTLLWFLLGCLPLVGGYSLQQTAVADETGTAPARRVNVPYTTAVIPDIPIEERAIFWFGQVGPTNNNYADGRIIYNDDRLHLTVHILDRWLYYQQNPSASEMPDWDAVTLYLNRNGNSGSAPTTDSYRFVAQVSWNEDRSTGAYHAAYQGNGSGWTAVSADIETVTGWRGQGFNNTAEDNGWNVTFRIPFSSLGLSGPPADGTVWGAALAVHDRDANGDNLPDTVWPEAMVANNPSTWAQFRFGLPTYETPIISTTSNITIRDGENGVTVPDNHVGGSVNCGGGIPPFWPTWGNTNYNPTSHEMNVQNQWDLGDYACFSKYYVTFPLDNLPADQAIVSASLSMYHFGNSLPDMAPTSVIQVLRLSESWDENTITWNNAPLALENVSRAWVDPLPLGHPGQFVTWDVSQAVADAYAASEPLRLVLYSADGPRHTGKYFNSSETFDPARRPTLQIEYGSAYGFTAELIPVLQAPDAGGSTSFTIDVQPTGGFTAPVSVQLGAVPADLDASLTSGVINSPPGQTALNVTHQNPGQTDGALYAIPLTLTGDGIERNVTAFVLVNGSQTFLPTVQR